RWPAYPPKQNHRSKSAGFPSARTRDPLFDHAPAEIGRNQSPLCVSHSLAKRGIGDSHPVCKACERLGFERSQLSSPGLSYAQPSEMSIALGVIDELSLINRGTTDHGSNYCDVLDLLFVDRIKVLRQNNEVGQLAWRDGS